MRFMTHSNLPQNTTAQNETAQHAQERAQQILDSLMEQTAQVEYDDVTVEKLINEYETLMA